MTITVPTKSLVSRLRKCADIWDDRFHEDNSHHIHRDEYAEISALCNEAADAINAARERAKERAKVLVEALKDAAADLDDYSPLTGNTVQTVASMRIRATIAAWEKANDQA